MKYSKIVICDFDGTITNQDVTDEILKKYTSEKWTIVGDRYMAGEISHAEMNELFANMVKVTPQKLASFLRTKVTLRDGFDLFVKELAMRKIPLVVVSGGWRFYIGEILKGFNLNFIESPKSLNTIRSKSINVISNRVEHEVSRNRWAMAFPWVAYSCKISSPCKGAVASLIKTNFGAKTIGIGNSRTDACFMKKVNELFTTGELSVMCFKAKVPHHQFTSFTEINL